MKKAFEKILIPLVLALSVLVSAAIAVPAETSLASVTETDSEFVTDEAVSQPDEPVSEPENSFIEANFGDMNKDGKLSAYDARHLLRCAASLETVTDYILMYGDYTADGHITSADARLALRVAAHIDSVICILHGHNYEPFVIAPDCTNEGYTTGRCSRCTAVDGTKTDMVSATGHVLVAEKKDASCTQSGWLKETCAVCGFVARDGKDGEPLGHSFSAWVKSGNKKTRSCTRCSYSETEKIQNSKIVYLTFDDGPGQYTERLLGYLRKYDVKATFFVTNQFPKYIYNLKTMAEDGHAIGVHTLTHSWSIYSGEYAYMKDFNAMHDIIKRETGIDTKIFRFPGGTNNTVSRSYCRGIMSAMSRKMINNGYYYFDWNVDCCDTLGYSASQIVNTTIGQIRGKSESIVLMHDIKKATVDAIPAIIEYCLNNGYVFDVLDENSPAIRFSPAN